MWPRTLLGYVAVDAMFIVGRSWPLPLNNEPYLENNNSIKMRRHSNKNYKSVGLSQP